MRSRHWLLVFAGWQLYVWGTRIANVAGDDGLTGTDKVLRVLLSLSFFLVAAAAIWAWRTMVGGAAVSSAAARAVQAGGAWTVVVWVVRGVDIAAGGHSTAFVVVHLVLALVSVALAVVAVRVVAASGRHRAAPVSGSATVSH